MSQACHEFGATPWLAAAGDGAVPDADVAVVVFKILSIEPGGSPHKPRWRLFGPSSPGDVQR
jgi:hypothetical protein